MPVFAVTIIGRLMPVLPEKREGAVRKGAFYNVSWGLSPPSYVPTKFHEPVGVANRALCSRRHLPICAG